MEAGLLPGVAAAVEAQQARFAPSAARAANVRALRDGARAVVTGQQAGLFLGPLYTVYKAATAVKVARALEQESGAPVVPVFWLQTEDHDLAEIAVCHAPRAHGAPLSLSVPVPSDNRIPVAHCALPDAVLECLRDLRAELGSLPHAEEHLSRLARHYRPGTPWAAAFAGVLAEVFSQAGLVLVDPRDPALAPAAAPVHRRAIAEADAIAAGLLERVAALQARGLPAPVHVREGAPLSFFHPDGPRGPRYRLAAAKAGFTLVGREGDEVVTRDALLDALEREPLRFSTSALLRPILQDALLPTAAYVGGPAEVAYYAQLPPLYEAFGRAPPRVVHRARFRVVDARTERLLQALGLRADDATEPEDALLSRLSGGAEKHRSAEAVERDLAGRLDRALAEGLATIPVEDLGLGTALRKTRGTVGRAASRFARNYERALLRRDRALVDGVRHVKAQLHPEGHPQERFFGLSAFAARYGEEAFVRRVLDEIVPFDSTLKDLRP